MFIAQIQYIPVQPLLIAVIAITVFNLLLTFVLLKRMNDARGTVSMPETERASIQTASPVPTRIYAGASDINNEVAAVISAALHLYKNDAHDFENTILTIDKVAKAYSPWSSKIYGLRKNPR